MYWNVSVAANHITESVENWKEHSKPSACVRIIYCILYLRDKINMKHQGLFQSLQWPLQIRDKELFFLCWPQWQKINYLNLRQSCNHTLSAISFVSLV